MSRVTPERRRLLIHVVAPLVLLSALFFSLTLPSISVPRLNAEEIDECLFVRQHMFGPEDELPTHGPPILPGVYLAGRYIPLMEDNDYVGAVELYLQLPFLWVLGNNPVALRMMPIVVSLLGLFAAFAVCRTWFGTPAGLGAAALTAAHPVFVHFTRQGHYKEEIFTVAFFWAGLYFFQRFLRSDKRPALLAMAGGLMFGLGLAHKITFIWYLAGCAVACVVLLRGRIHQVGVSVSKAAAAFAAFVVGTLPLTLYNVFNGFVTVRLMAERLVTPTPKDNVDNLEYLVNLSVRGKQLLSVIVGGEIWDTEWFGILEGVDILHNWPLYALFCVAAVAVPVLCAWNRGGLDRRAVVFLWIVFGVTFVLSPFTVSYHHPSHLLVMYPFPGIAVALLLVALARVIGRGWIGPAVAGSAAAAALAICIAQTAGYHAHARAYYPDPQDPWSSDFRRGFGKPPAEQTLIPQDRWLGEGADYPRDEDKGEQGDPRHPKPPKPPPPKPPPPPPPPEH